MGAGFSGGSLAVFTALAPAGAVAFAVVTAFVLTHGGLSSALRDRMNHATIVLLGVAWAGFIASATHLGTPANALHAVEGIGRSPLSNEVVAVVAFFFSRECTGFTPISFPIPADSPTFWPFRRSHRASP